MPSTSAAFWLAAFCAAAGCAGVPSLPRAVTVEEGRRTTVRLIQFADGGRAFTLQNDSSGRAVEVYSDTQIDPATKVVSDVQLQRLLDVFADSGLFVGASSSVPAEARSAIIITQNGRRHALHGAFYEAARKQAFSRAQAYFLTVYNGATAYHSADLHRRDLEAERDRARRDGPRTGGRKQ